MGNTVTVFFLVFCLFSVTGQNSTIIYSLSFEYMEGCETGSGDCYPVHINRQSKQDSLIIKFPNGGTISDVYLYADSSFSKWIDNDTKNPPSLKHDKKYAGEGQLVIDMTDLPDGKYRAHILSCGLGGIIEINILTTYTPCIPPIDTLDGMNVTPLTANQISKILTFSQFNNENATGRSGFPSKLYVTFLVDTIGSVRNPCIITQIKSDSFSEIENEVFDLLYKMAPFKPVNAERKIPVRFIAPIHID